VPKGKTEESIKKTQNRERHEKRKLKNSVTENENHAIDNH
jgi:hypothetical protein